MKRLFLGLSLLMPCLAWSQLNYPSYKGLLDEIAKTSSNSLVERAHIGKSYAGEQIPIIKIQSTKSPKPTLLIVAGVDGKHPAGVVNAMHVAQELIALPQNELKELLETKSIWIIPVLNIDAYKRNITDLQWTSGNGRVIDNDRDGRIDENPSKDLNGDGVISQMRIKSPAGVFKAHALLFDFLVNADPVKGEKGDYEVFIEGIDIDKDGRIGEDGAGGVNLDKNFGFDYPIFEAESGDYAASEPETRAIIDFIFDNPQIAAVLHFGLQNNLSSPEVFDPRKASERIVKSWQSNDVEVSKYVSHLYTQSVKSLGEAPKLPAGKGNFSSTIYYHTGKFSFVTPSWWTPSPSTDGKKVTKEEDKFVHWVKENNIQGAILPWQKVNHPDFPNQEVEVGGVVEIFKNNPPIEHLKSVASEHTNFILSLVRSMATLDFSTPKVTSLGDDIYRVEVQVYNTGKMPTYSAITDRLKYVPKLKTVLELQKSQQFISGKRLQTYPTLAAGKSMTFSWLVKGKGKTTLTVGCPTAGEKTIEVTL